MCRKIITGIAVVIFSFGLCSVALAGDPDNPSTQFDFNSSMTGQGMHGNTLTTTQDDMASRQADKPGMQEQNSAPCTVVINKATVNATDIPGSTSTCYGQYQGHFGS
jgi:hypothetical protein